MVERCLRVSHRGAQKSVIGRFFSTTLLYQKLGVRPRDRLYYMKLIVMHVIEMVNIQI